MMMMRTRDDGEEGRTDGRSVGEPAATKPQTAAIRQMTDWGAPPFHPSAIGGREKNFIKNKSISQGMSIEKRTKKNRTKNSKGEKVRDKERNSSLDEDRNLGRWNEGYNSSSLTRNESVHAPGIAAATAVA